MAFENFKNIPLNTTHHILEHPSNFVLVPAVITIFCGAIADLLIVSTIIKSKRWHSVFSFYILNWCICDALLLLLQPITYTAIFSVDYVTIKSAQIWLGIIVAVTIGNYLFVAALTLDWLFSNFFETCSARFRQYNKYQTTSIWLIVVILVIYVCCVSILEQTAVWIFAITTLSLVMYCIVQILWFIKRKASSQDTEQSNLALAMVSVYFVCWIPNYLIQGINAFEHTKVQDESMVVTCLVGYLNSLIMLTLLYYGDEDFGASFSMLCSCKPKESSGAQTEDIEAK